MEEIIPGLWIGDLACALATDYLSLAGVTHIVTAMKQALPSPIRLSDGRKIEEAQLYHVSIDDLSESPILVHLPGAVDFIDEAIEQRWIEDDGVDVDVDDKIESSSSISAEAKQKGQWATMGSGTVLVHCQAGISRSVAVSKARRKREIVSFS
jgi:dual specificity phosphatase 12